MTRWVLLSMVAVLFVACDEPAPSVDAGRRPDAGPADAAVLPDGAMAPDTGPLPDGALPDAGPPTVDGGTPRTSAQITLVHGTPAGAITPPLPIEGAIVTYTKAAAGDDPAGFFVQAERSGPALFVAVDASATIPPLSAGDVISFTVSGTAEVSGQLRVITLEGLSRTATGAPTAPLVQDLTAAADAQMAAPYESELVRIEATVSGVSAAAGPGHRRFRIRTAAVDDPLLVLRVADDVLATVPVRDGCTVSVGPSPAWRFLDSNQVQAYVASDIALSNCPPPAVVSAAAIDPTHVVVRFSSALDAASVMAADFTFAGGALSASGAVVDGDRVTLTTGAQTDGQSYTVIVSGVNDASGTPIGSSNTADFVGIGSGTASLVISEYLESTQSERVIEISNRGDVASGTDCVFLLYPNGNSTPNTPRPLAPIPAGESRVFCHTLASAPIMAACDVVDTPIVSFNGNDALEVVCGGVLHDSFGQVGTNPGDAGWGVSPSTVDSTLRRDCVGVGDRDSANAFDPSADGWTGLPPDTHDDLGSYCL